MWFVESNEMDEVFLRISISLQENKLGRSAKISTSSSTSFQSRVICIYTENFLDTDDVLRVGLELRRIGAIQTINYKPDIFTLSDDGIYGSNSLPKKIYQLTKNSNKLTCSRQNSGELDADIAKKLAEKQRYR